MQKYYFTYGSSENFPYQNGWTEVYAENMKQAESLFKAIHPDKIPGIINCAWVYTQKDFESFNYFKSGNFGVRCHEIIGAFDSPENILDCYPKAIRKLSDDPMRAAVSLSEYVGAMDFAEIIGLISKEENVQRKKEALRRFKNEGSKERCCFCGKPLPKITDRNNAAPVKDGVCCEKCNAAIVIPARIYLLNAGKRHE